MNLIKEIIQSPLFSKQKKKLKKIQIKILDEAVREIIQNPEAGPVKSGDLSNVRVYKFKHDKLMTLLAYEVMETTLFLYTFGPHENFYRDLKKYINR